MEEEEKKIEKRKWDKGKGGCAWKVTPRQLALGSSFHAVSSLQERNGPFFVKEGLGVKCGPRSLTQQLP